MQREAEHIEGDFNYKEDMKRKKRKKAFSIVFSPILILIVLFEYEKNNVLKKKYSNEMKFRK